MDDGDGDRLSFVMMKNLKWRTRQVEPTDETVSAAQTTGILAGSEKQINARQAI